MKILLTGGNSSLAQVLRPVLASFAEVQTAGRSGCDVMLDMAWPAERFELPQDVDTVIHLAANFGGPDFASILAAEEINVLGALKLAHTCHRAGVGQLVQVSSIFAGLGIKSPFYNSYALSKRHAEELTGLYCRSVGLPLVILRPAQFYGEGQVFRRHQPFLYALLDSAQCGKDIVLYGRNDALRNFIHVDDVAEIIARVVRQRIEGLYECSSLTNVRFSEIAAAAVAAFDSPSAIRFDTDKADIPDNAFAADDALYRRIGYFPKISLAQGLIREAERRKGLP
ncbi:MAG: NAD(P)-dependent oxidoreductase [Verrucomicrobiota bacterium]|nr:NAD(P)-dependent oxidoreductase [Verrucomicrobiota bacterium]